VRPVDIRGHKAGPRLAFDVCAARTETDENNLVGGFANDVDEIILRGTI